MCNCDRWCDYGKDALYYEGYERRYDYFYVPIKEPRAIYGPAVCPLVEVVFKRKVDKETGEIDLRLYIVKERIGNSVGWINVRDMTHLLVEILADICKKEGCKKLVCSSSAYKSGVQSCGTLKRVLKLWAGNTSPLQDDYERDCNVYKIFKEGVVDEYQNQEHPEMILIPRFLKQKHHHGHCRLVKFYLIYHYRG